MLIAPWLQPVSQSPSRASATGQETVRSLSVQGQEVLREAFVQGQSVRAVPAQEETVRDVPQEQPSPRFFQVVFAVQGQEALRGA